MAEDVKVSLREIDDAIFAGIDDNKELRRAFDDFVDDVHTTWVNIWVASGPHPYATGEYLEHIKKRKQTKWYRGHMRNYLEANKGMLIGEVYNDSPIAHLIEYGTGPDKPGGHSPWGPNTPTEEFAPMRKTYARFLV